MTTIQSALIVGGGAIGVDHHLPRLRDIIGCHSIEIYEPNTGRLETLQRDLGGDPQVKINAELPDGDFDLIVIATPPKFHLDYYRQYSKRCRYCVIEKPMALTAAECKAIAELESSGGAKVLIPMIRRTMPGYGLVKRLYHTKAFGELQSVIATEGGVFAWKAVSIGSFSRDLNGGGVLMDTGPHTLDLLFQVFESLTCDSSHMDGFSPAIEANCELEMKADGRVPVTLLLSRNRNLSSQLEFTFSDAKISIGIRSNRIRVEQKDGTRYVLFPDLVTDYNDPGFVDLFDAWYQDFVAAGDNLGVGPQEALNIAMVIDAAYEKAKPIEGGF